MAEVTGLAGTVTFRLGALGALAAERFAARIAVLDLKPKHAGVMVALDAKDAASQAELATSLGIAPSLMVSLADHLETMGAIARVRDPGDRRRQVLTLTAAGRKLLARCTAAATALDEELTEPLSAGRRAAMRSALGTMASHIGLPP